jgi:tetratricopeptide (TPR) repeat protein
MRASRHSCRTFAPRLFCLALLGLLTASLPASAQITRHKSKAQGSLAQAQEMVDGGNPQQAIPLLNTLIQKEPGNGAAYLLRSTARFLIDDIDGGKKDLDKALQLDPSQRQAWLHRGALEVSAKKYDAALAAFSQAEKLDPKAQDNDINLGAVLLLAGKLEGATQRFQAYLGKHGGVADAQYLVASNYALSGYSALAVEHLRQAIALDERSRLRARTDTNFAGLEKDRRYTDLLATDSYRAPAGSHFAAQAYDVSYDAQDGKLLGAVLEAMNVSKERYDPRVESAPDWALIWGDLRVKVTHTPDGKGRVEVSAPLDRLSEAEWKQRTDKLFRSVTLQLYRGRPSEGKKSK